MGQHQNLILFGYKGSGKTHCGYLLAQDLRSNFIDTDQWVEGLYEKEFHEKLNCRQISLKIREEGFRKLEERVIDSIEGVNNSVIAVGGGAVLNSENCLKLRKLGKLVYLEVDKVTIKQRIFNNGIPSFLDPNDPEKSFEEMYDERKSIYERVSSFKVNVQNKTERQILDELKIMIEIE